MGKLRELKRFRHLSIHFMYLSQGRTASLLCCLRLRTRSSAGRRREGRRGPGPPAACGPQWRSPHWLQVPSWGRGLTGCRKHFNNNFINVFFSSLCLIFACKWKGEIILLRKYFKLSFSWEPGFIKIFRKLYCHYQMSHNSLPNGHLLFTLLTESLDWLKVFFLLTW